MSLMLFADIRNNNMYTITFVLAVITCLANSKHRSKKEDKLLLSPIELIDLVREEQHKNRGSLPKSPAFVTETQTEKPKAEETEDVEFEPGSNCFFNVVRTIFYPT